MKWLLFFIISTACHLSVLVSHAQGFIGIEFKEVKKDSGIVVIIKSVMLQSPASKAGLKVSDIITEIDNHEINTELDVHEAIYGSTPNAAIKIQVIRDNQKKEFTVITDEIKLIRIKVTRESDYTFPYWLSSFDIIANGKYIGDIGNGESKDFYLPRTYDRRYYLLAKANILFEDCASDTQHVEVPIDYDIAATFTANDSHFKIKIKFPLSDSVTAYLFNDELRRREHSTWRRITCDSSKAPKWFKDATIKTLEGKYKETYRGKFFSSLLQTRVVFRLLNLMLVIYLLLGFLKRKLFLIIPLCIAILYPMSMLISILVGNILFDQEKYYPFEYYFFIAVCSLIVCLTLYAVRPIYELLTHSEEKVKKALGWIGLFFYFAELSKFIYEIIEWIRN
ncbi:MAG: PDZ domain-containing protein [Agriterribacter sp.]